MASKPKRQREILRLIRAQSVRTQEDLAAALALHGIDVSQVTLSRDLRELAVVKTASGYEEARRLGSDVGSKEDLARVLAEFLREVGTAQNLVVLKTEPGGAGPVALALDAVSWPEVVGTIAGDDTIFVATSDARTAETIRQRISSL